MAKKFITQLNEDPTAAVINAVNNYLKSIPGNQKPLSGVHYYLVELLEADYDMGDINFKLVQSVGGDEDEGPYVSRVFEITERQYEVDGSYNRQIAHILLTGHFNSWEGTEWDDKVVIVYPKQVMVVEYTTSAT